MFDAGSAVGTLGLDVSGYMQGMLQAQTVSALFPATVTNFLANPLLGFVGLLKEATSALTSFFVDAFQGATAQADKINDLATSLGVATEFLSGMELVAKQAGAGLEDVAAGMKFLQKNIADLEAGEDSALKRFGQLGLGADLIGKGTEEQFLIVGEALKNLESTAGRTNLAMELLGRGGGSLIPTFMQGTEAIREQMRQFDAYGATVSAASAASADAWGDAMGEIGIAWSGFKNMLAEPIREALLPYLHEALAWFRAHAPEVKQLASELASAAVTACMAVVEALKLVLENIEAAKGALAGVAFGGLAGFVAGGPVGGLIGAAGGGLLGGGIGSFFDTGQLVGGGGNRVITNNFSPTVNVSGGGNADENVRAVRQELLRMQQQYEVESTRGGL